MFFLGAICEPPSNFGEATPVWREGDAAIAPPSLTGALPGSRGGFAVLCTPLLGDPGVWGGGGQLVRLTTAPSCSIRLSSAPTPTSLGVAGAALPAAKSPG